MKILHVINNLNSGGAENLLKEMVPFQNKKYDVDILILSNKNNVFEESLKKQNINIYNTKISNNVYNPIQIIEIYKYIKKYDVIHVHLFPSFYWTAIANMFLFKGKRNLVVTEHSTSNNRRNKIIFKYLDKFIYSKYKKVIAISKATKDELMKWLDRNIDDDYIEVVNNGINLEKFKHAKSYNKIDIVDNYQDGDIILCMVARFNKQKDHDTVIKALAKLPKHYKLVLVGEGERLEEVKRLANKLNVLDRINFMGFRRDVGNIIKSCDISILSSHYEGFGLAAVEAMACEIPVIVSNVEGLRDVVDNSELTFNVGDENNLKEIITNISTNKLKYDEIKIKCINRTKNYEIYKMLNKLDDIYMSILD